MPPFQDRPRETSPPPLRIVGSGAPPAGPTGRSAASLALLSMPFLVHEPKRRRTALLLCLFFGWLGCHHFYVGKRSTGRLYLLTGGLFFIGVIVDLVRLWLGVFEDRFGRPLA